MKTFKIKLRQIVSYEQELDVVAKDELQAMGIAEDAANSGGAQVSMRKGEFEAVAVMTPTGWKQVYSRRR